VNANGQLDLGQLKLDVGALTEVVPSSLRGR
jgi:hypothetical protein